MKSCKWLGNDISKLWEICCHRNCKNYKHYPDSYNFVAMAKGCLYNVNVLPLKHRPPPLKLILINIGIRAQI